MRLSRAWLAAKRPLYLVPFDVVMVVNGES